MRWEVTGADATSGAEGTITVDAATAEGAEQQVRYNGMLVSKVTKAGPKPKGATLIAPPTPVAHLVTPDYRAIVDGAKVLSFFAALLTTAGVLSVLAAILLALMAAVSSQQGGLDTSDKHLVVGAVAGCLVCGVYCFAAAAFLGMQGELALAVRDIARNSFRR